MFGLVNLHFRTIVPLCFPSYYYLRVWHMPFCMSRIMIEEYLVERIVSVNSGGNGQRWSEP